MRAASMVSQDASPAEREQDYKALMQAVAQKQDREAFSGLFSHFAPRLKSWFLRNGMDGDTAEELVQKTMIRVWEKAARYNPARASVSTWIFTLARNIRIDHLRAQPLPALDLDDPALALMDDADSAAVKIEKEEQERKLRRAIGTLPAEQSDLLNKAFFEGKSHIKIAAETALPLGTIKSRLRLALEKLRRKMTDDNA